MDIMPDGKPLQVAYKTPFASALLGADSIMVQHTLPTDGRWVIWSTVEHQLNEVSGGAARGSLRLYARGMGGKRTFQIGGTDPVFQTMSSDGSKVFFLEGGELYEFDTASDTQTDLTVGGGKAGAQVQNAVLGASEDGSYLYFVARGVLASGATSGEDNLYVLHDGAGGWTTM